MVTTKELARGRSTYKIDPKQLVIYGYDRGPKIGEHPLARPVTEPSAELIQSFKERGVEKAVWVARIGADLVVVDGRTRTIGARKVGLEEVEFVMKEGDALHLLGLSFLANLGAHGEKPAEIAEAAVKMNEAGFSPEQIASYLQVGVPMVKVYLTWKDLSEPSKKLVEKGEMSFTAASKLKGLDDAAQAAEIEKMREAGGLTVAAANATRAARTATKKAAKKKGRKAAQVDVAAAPKRRILRRLVERVESKELETKVDVRSDFWLGVKFSQGLLSPKSIKGLSAAIAEVSAKKTAAAQ